VTGPDYESYVDRKIRQAADSGEFDDLAGEGEPLEILNEPYEPGWWVKRWVVRERLKDVTAPLSKPGD